MLVNSKTTVYWIIVVLTGVLGKPYIDTKAGPYDIEVLKFEACVNSGTGETFIPTRLTKVDRNTLVYNESFRIQPPIDKYAKLYVELQKSGASGGYTPRYMEHTFVGCDVIFPLAEDNIKRFFKTTEVKVEGCPIPAGNFTAKNFDMKIVGSVPVMIYGSYRMIFTLYHSGRKVGCLTAYGNVVPKSII